MFRPSPALPRESGRPEARRDALWRPNLSCISTTVLAAQAYVLGEFPWRVHVGEKSGIKDFVAPPRCYPPNRPSEEMYLVAGRVHDGQRKSGRRLSYPARRPRPRRLRESALAVYRAGRALCWRTWLWLNLLSAIGCSRLFYGSSQPGHVVFSDICLFAPRSGAEASFVTPILRTDGPRFECGSLHPHRLDNNWAYFNFALINDQTRPGLRLRPRSELLHGRDSDGAGAKAAATTA